MGCACWIVVALLVRCCFVVGKILAVAGHRHAWPLLCCWLYNRRGKPAKDGKRYRSLPSQVGGYRGEEDIAVLSNILSFSALECVLKGSGGDANIPLLFLLSWMNTSTVYLFLLW